MTSDSPQPEKVEPLLQIFYGKECLEIEDVTLSWSY